MSGLEVAGLVLGVFPVLTQMVSSYRGELVGRDAAYLLESLRNNELVFRNGIELMLRSIIPATELEVLLEDLGGDAWKDDALNDRIMTQMGRDARAIIRNLKDIYRTLSRLKQTLPVSRSASAHNRPRNVLIGQLRLAMPIRIRTLLLDVPSRSSRALFMVLVTRPVSTGSSNASQSFADSPKTTLT